MPEPTEQDPDVVGKLQPATLESRSYILEIDCQFLIASVS
jgi:hypothetical protein